MVNQFSRTEMLIGKNAIKKLREAHVAVCGIGGVGSYVVEALARAGIGELTLVDFDEVSLTNINRQLIALHSTIGKSKVEVARDRVLDINPNIKINIFNTRLGGEEGILFNENVSYVVDAIDSVEAKISLVVNARDKQIPIISCMGTGNKLDPTKLEISDISKTSVCPLARVVRKKLREKGITKLKVLYSKEEPVKCDEEVMKECQLETSKSYVPGSISFVPSVAGLLIASEVVKDLINNWFYKSLTVLFAME